MSEIVKEEVEVKELIERSREGDRSAFDLLIDRVRPRLRSLIEARLGQALRGQVDPEDLVQEVTLKALESLGSFHDQGEGSFLRWLGGIAEHRILDLVDPRRKRPHVGIEGDVRASGPTSSKVLRREERFHRLEAAFDRLSPEHREVIVLARIEGLSREEIARKMNRSPGAVGQLLWRALKCLKATFGDTESLHLPPRSLAQGEGDGKRPDPS
jgi:RNA polymerase sigma-70 factor (ECF subfamily)